MPRGLGHGSAGVLPPPHVLPEIDLEVNQIAVFADHMGMFYVVCSLYLCMGPCEIVMGVR